MTYAPGFRHNAPSRSDPGLASDPRPATRLELDLDIDRALDDLRRTFPGICIWHGEWSGSLWALLPDRLVEAKTSLDLARLLRAALPRPQPPRPGPSTCRPDGTWSPASPRPAQRPTSRNAQAWRPERVLRWLLTSCLHMTTAPAAPR
jgi:hypothetical protein